MNLAEFLADQAGLLALGAGLIVALIVNEWVLARRSGPQLAPYAAVKLINEEKARVIDIRAPADFKRGHILGADNLPPARHADLQQQVEKNPNKPVILVCAMGVAAKSLARKLRAAGAQSVYPLAGGLNAWEGAGMPLTTQTNTSKKKRKA